VSDKRQQEKLALEGGLKAVTSIEGKGQPKIGVDEFMAVAERFGFSESVLGKIRKAVESGDVGEGAYLANYYAGLKQTKNEEYAALARKLFGVGYAIPMSSGTGALHSAFVAAGVGPGTEVICPAVGFFATAAAVVSSKGIPVFCDVNESMQIDPTKIEALITDRTVAIAPTHYQGGVCDMKSVMKVARKHKIKVIEDCAQSCGASYAGKLVGTYGDIGCFSISAYKIVGGGEGGLLITDKLRLYERANQLAECGGLWRPIRFDPPRYKGELYCGTNYRLSELEAAIDVVQMKKMPATVKRFRAAYTRVLKGLKTFKGITPGLVNDIEGEVGYTLRFFPESPRLAAKIAEALRAENIPAGTRGPSGRDDWHIYHYMYPVTLKQGPTPDNCPFECPLYLQAGGDVNYAKGQCPVADDLFDRAVSIRISQWYNAADCKHIANGINKVLAAYCEPDPDGKPWM
jgi:8-amino-3,8-dideoxy-alpha-D-manno-octulosonate transaminase